MPAFKDPNGEESFRVCRIAQEICSACPLADRHIRYTSSSQRRNNHGFTGIGKRIPEILRAECVDPGSDLHSDSLLQQCSTVMLEYG